MENLDIVLMLMLMLMVPFVAVWWVIFSKAGFRRTLSLLMAVPLVNVVVFIFFAFGEWPVLRAEKNRHGGLGFEGSTSPTTVVTFPDHNLEAAIREAVNKPTGNITAAGLAPLGVLDARGKGIADLTGIEYCVNLTELWLYSNEISDISPLATLTNLTVLWLDENQISDISPLATLTNLTELWLYSNEISDISSLATLTNLATLDLNYNQISDIFPLAPLTNLTVLDLNYNQISDISPLAPLTNLTLLDLNYNQISDISPLAPLTNLTLLDLNYNQISDISPLLATPGLSSGDKVYLEDNPLDTQSRNTYIPQLKKRGVDIKR